MRMRTLMVCDSFPSFALFIPNPWTFADPLRPQPKTTQPTITQMKKRRRTTTTMTLTLMIQRARMAGLGTCLATVDT